MRCGIIRESFGWLPGVPMSTLPISYILWLALIFDGSGRDWFYRGM